MRRYLLTVVSLFFIVFTFAQNGIFYPAERLSNSLITSICQDKTGFIWVGTEFGLNRFDGYRFVKYYHNDKDSTSLKHNNVVSMLCDREGNLWIGTNKGFQLYDYARDRFITYRFPDNNQPRINDILQMSNGKILVGTAGYGLYEVNVEKHTLKNVTYKSAKGSELYFSHLFEGQEGVLWVGGTNTITCGTEKKILKRFDPVYGVPTGFVNYNGRVVSVCRDKLIMDDNGKEVSDFFEMPDLGGKSPSLRTAVKDRQGNVFVGTRGNGLFWIPQGSRKLQRHPVRIHGLDMSSIRIWALAEDRDGNIWLGCQQRGLVMIPSRKALFNAWNFCDRKIEIGTHVSSITDDVGGIIWCTVQDKGVFGFDLQGNIVGQPSAPDGVEYIYHDSKRDYWLGTKKGVYKYNPMTGASKLVVNKPCYTYNSVTDDHQGHLFFSAFSKGMVMYDRETEKVRTFSMNDNDKRRGRLCNDWIMDLSSDVDKNVWAATSAGVSCYDPKHDTFRPHGWEVLLQDTMCHAVCKTSRGDMLIGTECGLFIWERKKNSCHRFYGSEVLSNLVVGYMVEDLKGNIWCSTSNGIWMFDLKKATWTSYVSGSGLTSHEYVTSVGMHGDDERIFFATGEGITAFMPQMVMGAKSKVGNVMLTGFYIDGAPVSIVTKSGGDNVTDMPVSVSRHFRVSYQDNSFTMEFSLLNYDDADNIVFEYRLGSSKSWTRTEAGQNFIAFTHLASGRYELEVRAIDNGVVSEVETYILEVAAPWYASPIAYLIYMLLAASLILFGIWAYRKRIHQQMDEDKMKFLINATHDIRSPLTLIMSPLSKVKDMVADILAGNAEPEVIKESIGSMQQELAVIDRNSQRILGLVNSILDVRKIDKQQMGLHCRETDMKEFVEIIYKVFEYNARERGISYTFEAIQQEESIIGGGEFKRRLPILAWIDSVQFDKVVSNLLSNAFKYINDGGSIHIKLSTGHDDNVKGPLRNYVEIQITDTGIGMHEDVIQHLFDRFYQAKNTSNEQHVGTGIGLNLCKMIVDMHHGSIEGVNRTDGVKGSVFTVRIPVGNEHLTKEEIDTQVEKSATLHVRSKQPPRSSYHVLIVDDDEEIGEYISRELAPFYHCAVCHNGKEGLKELLSNKYDAVVSDVMMPEMDGFTMLRMLKSNVNISHIPVILLTTKSDIANRLEGLEKGADAYMTKPFEMDELHLTIDNLIENHLRLKGKFSGAQQPTDEIEAPEVKGNDEQLMERIIKSVNEHLADSDYGVDTMCEEVGISRAHLYRKMKDLTGISVSEFVRNIRLEQAARLLREQKLNITQVAYSVGFSSLGYFSTVFRKHFGISPREFIEQQ